MSPADKKFAEWVKENSSIPWIDSDIVEMAFNAGWDARIDEKPANIQCTGCNGLGKIGFGTGLPLSICPKCDGSGKI